MTCLGVLDKKKIVIKITKEFFIFYLQSPNPCVVSVVGVVTVFVLQYWISGGVESLFWSTKVSGLFS